MYQLCLAVSPVVGVVALISTQRLDTLKYLDQIQVDGTILDAQIQVLKYRY